MRKAKVRLGLKVAKAFIPLGPEVGREAEVDWGTALAIIGGKPTTVKFFGMRSRYSANTSCAAIPVSDSRPFLTPICTPLGFSGDLSSPGL